MSGITYVNVHGQPVDPGRLQKSNTSAPKKTPGLKRVYEQDSAVESHGFEVVGISTNTLRAARAEHEVLADFDEQTWLARQKPKRSIPRVFWSAEAAEQAAGMVRAGGGWLLVRVVEIMKG